MVKKSIINFDPWLSPYQKQLQMRNDYVKAKSEQILVDQKIEDFALGHLYFGLHKTSSGWTFREWAPHATAVYFLSQATGWQKDRRFALRKKAAGVWQIDLQAQALKHLDHYKLLIEWPGGQGERLPSYAKYVVQNQQNYVFDAVVWSPSKIYQWKHRSPTFNEAPLIYEAHIGMSSNQSTVASFNHFKEQVLPRIAALGYNTVQLMAIQEHPYYGSFGYHVSNFFAASSRFGTPDELKALIDEAHRLGLCVIMDIVHSHAVKNETEGLSRFDGSLHQYFHSGARGEHSAWDSRVFDYGKPEVVHFLLSNLRFWLDEYHFDGFRFDGVTSMLYHDHGLGKDFSSYDDYFSANLEKDALTYLKLANDLIHKINPRALTIAEDTSALPGLAAASSLGGIGFDYRLSMGVPDLWIKTLKEKRDEDWDLAHLIHELTTHRPEEKTISYAESHDQALVGDKTLIFRLIDKEMYYHMQVDDQNLIVERGLALHKMIRLLTASTNSGGYLNFMGNEFGHPEWIDFPRAGNNWSYKYARRQWDLVDNPNLKYHFLHNFDLQMIALLKKLKQTAIEYLYIEQAQNLVSFMRGNYLFVFNFAPNRSYSDFALPAKPGQYKLVLSSDQTIFGGQDRVASDLDYSANSDSRLKVYAPARTATVFKLIK